MRHLHATHPDRYEGIFTAPEIGPRIQRTADGLHSPREIPGGFVELNRSAGSIMGVVARLVAFFGVDAASVRYAIREA